MLKLLSSLAIAGVGIANAQLPPLTLTDGSAPSSVEAPWHCDPTGPPSIALSADSSGITMTMTYYREALTDDQGTPADRAVHTSGFFKLKSGDARLEKEGNDWMTVGGSLDTGYYTSSQDFIGLCDNANAIAFTRDNIFAHGGLTRAGATCGAVPTNATIYADADCDPISSEAYCTSVVDKNANEWIIQAVEAAEAGQNCSAKYTATFTKTINEFEVLGGQDQIVTVQSEAGVRQLTWDFYTVELAEPGAAGGTVAARYTKHSFLTDFSTTAAVTIAIDSSDVLPPLFLQVVSVEGNRVLASPTVGVLDFKLHVYVRQGDVSGTVEQIDLNALDTPVVTSATWPETGGSATVVCEAIPYDDEAGSPDSYFEYADGTRVEIGANDLPPSIQNQLTDETATDSTLKWVRYDVYHRCTYTLSTVADITEELVIPANTITLDYELAKSGVVVSDLNDKPAFSFGTSITLPGRDEEVVQLPFQLSIEDMLESTMTPAASGAYDSFSELIYANEANDLGENSVAWTQAIAFHVELQEAADRDNFRLDPLVMMVVAHSTVSGASVADSTQYLGTGAGSGQTGSAGTSQLDATFCGLNAGTAVGAMLMSDSSLFSIATQTEIDSYASADATGKSALETTLRDRVLASESFVPGNNVESIPWGSYLTSDAALEIARLSLNNNMTAEDIDFFANLPQIGGLDQSRYYFHDTTAGYMVPMRNRMRLSTGEGGGFEVRFCAITQVSTHRPLTVGGQTDLYVSAAAANAASAVGTSTEVVNSGVKYYQADASRRHMSRRILSLGTPVVFSSEKIIKRIPENAGTSMRPVTFQGEPMNATPSPSPSPSPIADHKHDHDHDNSTEENYQMAIIILSSVLAVVTLVGVIYMMFKWCCPQACGGSCGPRYVYLGEPAPSNQYPTMPSSTKPMYMLSPPFVGSRPNQRKSGASKA